MARHVRLGVKQRRGRWLAGPPRRPPVAYEHVAQVVLPVQTEGRAPPFLNANHHTAREVLRSAVVPGDRVQRLCEPPPPGLERCPAGAVQLAVAIRQGSVEQRRDVAPGATLVVGHVGEGDREHAVRAREIPGDVQHQTGERLAPPPGRAALVGGARGLPRLAVLQQVTHPLADDPFVARADFDGLVERGEQPGAGLAYPRWLLRRRLVVAAAFIPVANPPDALAARVAPAAVALRQVDASRRLERLLRTPHGPEDGDRIAPVDTPHAGGER